jgi:hypothetical protein
MIRQILKNPSLLLAGGYAAGQGSMFLTQLAVKHFGFNETLGIIVILVSVVSFALQFMDIGNSTFMVRAITRAEDDVASEFLIARAVVAFFTCLLFSAWVYFEHKEIVSMATLVAIPIIGAICGGTATAYLEANRRYLLLTIANGMPWLTMSLVCGISTFYLNTNYIFNIVLIAVAVICLAIALFTLAGSILRFSFFPKLRFKSIQSVWSFVQPQMATQVWARVVIFEVNSQIGLAGLGIFGLFRYMQTAMVLTLGFMTRPQLQKYITSREKNYDYKLVDLLLLYKTAFAYALLGPILWVGSIMVVVPAEWSGVVQWLILVAALPLTLLSIAVTQLNQLTKSSRYILIVETTCLLMNIVTFYSIRSTSTGGAIVAGEVLGALTNLVVYLLTKKLH